MGNGDGHDTQIRRHRVSQAVAQHHSAARQALGFGEQHIVCAHLVKKPVSDHVGIVPQVPEHHDRKRQDEVRGAVGDVILLPDGVGPRARQHAQLDGEDQNEQQRQPEFRNAARDGAELADRAVEKRSLPLRAEHPEQQRERENEHKADAAEKECVARAARDDLARGHFVLIRDAEIPVQGVLRPADILREDGLVEAELFLRLRALLRRQLLRAVTVVGHERVARGEA